MSTKRKNPSDDTPASVPSSVGVEEQEKIRQEIRSELEPEMRQHFEQQLARTKDDLQVQQREAIKTAVEQWQKKEAEKMAPMSPESIQKMLDQEYAEFKLTLPNDGKKVNFILRELPLFYEKKFFKIAKETLADAVAELGGASFKLTDDDVFAQITGLMDVFEPVFDVMCECCVICLNHDGKLEWLNADWVGKNMTSYRIMSVIQAQTELNKLRDFFSVLFQGFQNTSATAKAAVLQ